MKVNPPPNWNSLRIDNSVAYKSLSRHLETGPAYKAKTIWLLIRLSKVGWLYYVPVVSGLLKTANSLVYGHIAESEYLDTKTHINPILPNPNPLPDVVDVLIIGSGPGGAVAAQIESTNDSLSISVLERGYWPRTSHFAHHSISHVVNDFYQGGQELIISKGLALYAQGNTVGGGSEVNSGLYHKLPEIYRDDYFAALSIDEQTWDLAEHKIYEWLQPEVMNVQSSDSVIARGSEKLKFEYTNVPRWRSYKDDGTYAHRGMNETFWKQFVSLSNKTIHSGIEVIRIDASNSEDLLVHVMDLSNRSIKIIKAKRLHVSAGTISTPTLLLRSRLIKLKDIRFLWHPMTRVVVETSEGDLGRGDIDPFQAWTPDRKLKFGSAVSTPSLLAIALGRKVTVEESKRLRSYYVSYSSTGRGGILPFINLPWYLYSKADKKMQEDGLSALVNMISEGGARIVNGDQLHPNKHSTVHIFGSLPIGSDIYLPGSNQLKRDPRIRISDGSLLPVGPGVNPQGVIMTTVYAANRLLHSK